MNDWTDTPATLATNPDTRALLRTLQDEGWEGRLTSKSHIQLRHPDADQLVVCPSTPSDARSQRNTLSDARRALRASRLARDGKSCNT